jgi:glycosyltransferase involved in cell wall biosynthesis
MPTSDIRNGEPRPLISVIIPTHNRSDLVREAIDSVLTQEPFGGALELVVVDDNSSDDTPEVIRQYKKAKYVRAREGTPAGARNVGIANATGTWIAFLDDDDVWLPTKLKVFTEAIRASPHTRVMFSAAYICDDRLKRGALWPGPQQLDRDRLYTSVLADAITPSVFMVHRDVLESVGLFDPGVYRAEDRDLLARAARAGFNFLRIEEPLVLYRGRARLDGGQLHKTFKTTMMVLRRELAIRHRTRPGWLRRKRIALKVRGWYVDQILRAARQETELGQPSKATELSRVALAISPAHWLRHRIGRAGNS